MSDLVTLDVNLVCADNNIGFPRMWIAQPTGATITAAYVGPDPWPIGKGPDRWSAFFDLLGKMLS